MFLLGVMLTFIQSPSLSPWGPKPSPSGLSQLRPPRAGFVRPGFPSQAGPTRAEVGLILDLPIDIKDPKDPK